MSREGLKEGRLSRKGMLQLKEQKPWGRNVPGMLEEPHGVHCGWNRMGEVVQTGVRSC